jgi:DNA repair exonuclease SbcCD nuclease subunit
VKIALITDTHWGARGDNLAFLEYFNRFYYEQFFPYLEEHKIDNIIHLGDIVDRRKYINFVTARHLRKFVQTCHEKDIQLDVIIGNHDTFYKNTNDVNSMRELFSDSVLNINFYDEPQEIVRDGLTIGILPWVCSGNFDASMAFLDDTRAQVLFGHLEIAGFEMYRGAVNDHGFDTKLFNKFDIVCSGHFHHKSSRGNIFYLGAPYEITWSDWNDPRGFHIFDTDTRELTFIENRYKMFHKVHYNDSNNDMESLLDIDIDQFTGTMVKVIVHEKNNPYWFDMFIDKIEKAGVIDLQVVEDNLNLQLEDDDDIVSEAEDTLTILRKYTDQFSGRVEKTKLDNFLSTLYAEALSVE